MAGLIGRSIALSLEGSVTVESDKGTARAHEHRFSQKLIMGRSHRDGCAPILSELSELSATFEHRNSRTQFRGRKKYCQNGGMAFAPNSSAASARPGSMKGIMALSAGPRKAPTLQG
jgi:hypothetical protein